MNSFNPHKQFCEVGKIIFLCSIKRPMKVKVTQPCLTLCNPKDYSPRGSSVHGILQARILEWVAIPFSRGSSQTRDWTPHCRRILYHLSHHGSPKILGVGSLSLLQQIFPTQESNWVSFSAGGFFTCWVTREAHKIAQSHATNNGARILNLGRLAWKSWLSQ